MSKTVDLPALPLKGGFTRRGAIRTTAAAAASLAAGVVPALAEPDAPTPAPAPAPAVNPVLAARAQRLVLLARQCREFAERVAEIEDLVTLACPKPDPLSQPNIGGLVDEATAATERVITICLPAERDPAWVRWEEATAAAQVAHKQQEAAEGERRGLPAASRRSDYAHKRLDRLARQLAATPARSPAEVALKADAVLSLIGSHFVDREGDIQRHADTLLAALRDAVRLGVLG